MVSYRKEIPSSLDLLPLGERYGDKNKARQRARPSAKFNHVRSQIDHGKKEKKSSVMDAAEGNKLVRRKGEHFGRIAPTTLADYINNGQASISLNRNLNDIQILRQGHFPTKRPPAETNEPKIILLDLRSTQEYMDGHITKAISFPAENIQRDQVFAQLGVYKNKPDKMVVVYHGDERHGIIQSRVIFEKGFDNIYLLSGGLCIFEEEYPSLIQRRAQTAISNQNCAAGVAAALSATSPNAKIGGNMPFDGQQSQQIRASTARSTARGGQRATYLR